MTRKNFYVLVDKTNNTVLSYPVELPENWNNINGLNSFTDEQLSDLEWAGQPLFAWVKFDTKFSNDYTFGDNWITFAKEIVKETYAKLRWNAESKGISYKDIEIETNDRTRTTILLKKQLMSEGSTETFSWKYNGSIIKFTAEDVDNISNAINNYVQNCYEVEASLIEKLDTVKSPLDLTEFNLEIEWPSNDYNSLIS
jgi:hypothetical protein